MDSSTYFPRARPGAAHALSTRARSLRPVLAGLLFVVLGVGAAAPAMAAGDDPITRMDVEVEAARDGGTMRVTQDFDMEFDGDEDHGPYLTFTDRQRVPDDPDQWRVLEYTDFTATSDSGAPVDVHVEREDGGLAVRIGDEDTEVEGRQHYRLTYAVDGVVNPAATQAANQGQAPGGDRAVGDEVYWNVIGSGWETDLADVSVRITGPEPVVYTTCFAGDSEDDAPCTTHSSQGDTAEFTQDALDAGQGLTVVAGWPIDTFHDAAPMFTKRNHPGNMFPLEAGPLGVALASLVLGGGAAAWLFRRHGRDQAYAGLTPGLRPAGAAGAQAVGARQDDPVAVRFTPPDDAYAGEIGVLVDGSADQRDVLSGIVDLAVRGHLWIEEVPASVGEDAGVLERMTAKAYAKDTDWRLHRIDGTAGTSIEQGELPAPLADLKGRLFASSDAPLLVKDLGEEMHQVVNQGQTALYREVIDRGWFRQRPDVQKGVWMGVGLAMFLLGAGAAIGLGFVGWGWAGIGLAVVGIVVAVMGMFVSARTPEGSAVLAQAEGFKEYLLTAEADQIRVEEDHDIFSRYLPWAIAFGVESRWAELFRGMVAAGRPVAEPGWYTSPTGMSIWATTSPFLGADNSFMDVAHGTHDGMNSMGASGVSGMGGSVGGGVGGGGGGSW